jgi:DNA-directed RNA polymerase subunit N (RpoN/RPB10)
MSEKVQDNKIEDKNNNEEIKKVLDDMDTYKYCKTDILHKVNFMSKMDKFVFDSLPLTNSQKEELLLSLYPNTQ